MEPKRTRLQSDVELKFCVIEVRYAEGDWFDAVKDGDAIKRMVLVTQSLEELGLIDLFMSFDEPQVLESEAYKSAFQLQGVRAYPTSVSFEPGSEVIEIVVAVSSFVVATANLQVAQEQLSIAKNHLPDIEAAARRYCSRLIDTIKAKFEVEAKIQREESISRSSVSLSFNVTGSVTVLRDRKTGDRWAREYEVKRRRR